MAVELIKTNSVPAEDPNTEPPIDDQGYEDSLDVDSGDTGGVDGDAPVGDPLADDPVEIDQDLFLDGLEPGGEFSGDSGSAPAYAATEAGIHSWLDELLSSGKITQAQFNQYIGRIQYAGSLSPTGQQNALNEIHSELSADFATEVSEGDDLGLDIPETPGMGVSNESLDAFINQVNQSSFDQEIKDSLIAEAEKLRTEMQGIQNENEDALASLDQRFSDLQASFQGLLELPPEISGVVDKLDKMGIKIDAATLMAKATEFGIDLKAVLTPAEGVPPALTGEFLQFLAALDPDIKEDLEKIKNLTEEKAAKVREMGKKAVDISEHNKASTTDENDIHDFSPHQFLYDAKYFNSEYDKKIGRLNKHVRDDYIDLLSVFFTGVDIGKVNPNKLDDSWKNSAQAVASSGGAPAGVTVGASATTGAGVGMVVGGIFLPGIGAIPGAIAGGLIGAGVGLVVESGIFGGTSTWHADSMGNTWHADYRRHLASDQIQFGEVVLDIVNATTGEPQVTLGGTDLPPPVQLVEVMFDGEGAGEWYPTGIRTYDDPIQPLGYDADEGGSSLPW